VGAVTFLLDGRTLCVDSSPPFECDVQLLGEDVGGKLLTAVATDDAGRTGIATRALFVRRFKPAAVAVEVDRIGRPGIPAEVEVEGRIVLPEGVQADPGCDGGEVRIWFQHRLREFSPGVVNIDESCEFTFSRTFSGGPRLDRIEVLRTRVRFTGSLHLRPRNAPVERVRIQ
jgi:hypothetical protein